MIDRYSSAIFIFAATATAAACTNDPEHLPSPPGQSYTRPPRGNATHTGDAPFANVGGDFAYADMAHGIAATASGLVELALEGDHAGMPIDSFHQWTLTSSSGFGAAASAIAVPTPAQVAGRELAFFLPNARPQIGILEIDTNGTQGRVLTEAALVEPLASDFPSALAAVADGLWVVDAVFGPGSSVHFYPFSSLGNRGTMLTEEAGRRYAPQFGDVNGDQTPDSASLGKLTFADSGRVGLVSFSFLAPAPAGAAGGVLAFDTATGAELGRLILPITASSTSAIEFVGAVGATRDRVVVISAQKSPMFEDVGGTVAIYRVASWSPFQVIDEDPAKAFDQPESAVATTLANPVGLAIRGAVALVVDAPFFAEGALDIIPVGIGAKVTSSVALGPLYSMGFGVPGDPKISADSRSVLIPSEVGLVRVEITD